MSIVRQNNFEGITNGSTLTTGNTATGGDAASSITIGGSVTVTASTDFAAHGTISMKIVGNATNGAGSIDWSSLPAMTTDFYCRVYLYQPAASKPPGNAYLLKTGSGGVAGTQGMRLNVNNANQFVIQNAAGTAVATSTGTIANDQWVRFEIRIKPSTTVGEVEVRYYASADSATITETLSATAQVLIASMDTVRFGNAETNNPGTRYIDDVAVDNAAWLGAATSNQVMAPASDITTSGWTTTGAASPYLALDEAVADDGDYVTSPTNPSSSVLEVKLASAVDPASSTGHAFSYRLRANSAASSSVTVGLYQGATLIASEVRTPVPASFTSYTLTLTGPQADAISDYTDLRMRFTATAS